MAELTDYFAGRVAEKYDESSAWMFDPAVVDPAVDFLADLAGDGAALELGIGTGRIALPLRQLGVRVAGIDLSPDMVAQLRKKPGAEDIEVTIGDSASATVAGTFTLAYIVWNTIMNLTTQEAQVACFRNAARHLEAGGCFVIEVGMPDLQRLPRGETFRPFHVGRNHIGIDEYDVANQGLISHHYRGSAVASAPFRYVWPSELDLMAQLAGMRPRERWSDWRREPFTSESEKLIGVWEKPA
ncbi:MAG TPA: class I SAM-dependent methyltransferase [Gaiellaceae bacterium]|nr:class I SAM-dependent methyltransferase [Gaiellaceae bacterium]